MIVSPVDQAVITRALIAAADEMGVKLIRSAHSPVVREAQDCSAAILDKFGRVVAQAELIPIQLGSITHTFKACLEYHPLDTLCEGDFLINNDPYSGGQHLPDIFLFTPVFLEKELIGVTATVVHHIDLGGGAPGLNPNAGDVHEEGITFPPSKYTVEKDWMGGPFERLVRANVRMPEATIGDLNAQFAANAVGAERLRDLCRKFSSEIISVAMNEMLDYSERRIRTAISKAPDGEYYGEAHLDDDGINNVPVPIKVQLSIKGDTLNIDFEGTAEQVKSNMNSPFASSVSSAIACVKSVLTDPDIPFNEGAERAINVKIPYGSILNPRPRAPVRARLLPSYRVVNAVMKALGEAVPGRVIAPGFDTTSVCCLSHKSADGYNIYLEIFGGGFGAGPNYDGCDAVDSMLSNCSNIPIESMESDYPFFRVEDYSLRSSSGGNGKFRGGMGFQKTYKILSDDVTFATYGDRFRIAPEGVLGGGAGAQAETFVERGGQVIQLESKQQFVLHEGDILVVRTGGGGGYGLPSERNARLRENDKLSGILTNQD
ncbi:MAG: hydantoinase B/oxoprolinase family protein [Pseudomonadota bacterium]|jgi:N-methylhydantoinase B|nr:hydantoinase B/oxoprolinase family protein [Pseudomonadota bacterium]MEC7387129.1 hydantoinase B/oxoprolinase family protein [Pseudomonadota bacterium]MEC8234616.1 hydantoinase B/oxoprolinase family protein [Pseudomonadota bacterium]MEC8751510.1 hydantoinase B/oxoprolinase family protein [Pseudomonadota bacterium]MED5300790.1 hydantoinase B/oxoprolinase family protein [Pseudomonadota bacterium]|tara:strand:- start:1047 stop:2681 length:1635 start_codon:yes stop_codon:yes gene_type:complete